MKVILERNVLGNALARAARIIERRGTIPILNNLVLTAHQDSLRLQGTDLDIEIVDTIPAEVATPGAVAAPAHLLADIVRKLPEGAQVMLERKAEDAPLAVRAGRSRFTLQTLPVADYPDLSGGADTAATFTLPAKLLRRMIDSTQFAISTEETRYYLNGIYFHIDPAGALAAVATDGHRLARVLAEAPAGAGAMPGVIVPRKAVGEFSRALPDDGEVSLTVSANKIRLTAGALTLTSKVIDGTFPDYARVIPTANDKVLTLDTEQFEKALDRVATVANERGRSVRLSATPGTLTIESANAEAGQAAVEDLDIECETEALIGFNPKYLGEILAQCGSDTVEMRLADPGSPALFTGVGVADAVFVLMPMRV